MSNVLTLNETCELSDLHRSGTTPFEEVRLEKFAMLMGTGFGTPHQSYVDCFSVSPDESHRLIRLMARQLASKKCMAARIGVYRHEHIACLKAEVMFDKVEAVDILVQRVRNDATHSRDIPNLISKIGDIIGWGEKDTSKVDPLVKLLGQLKTRGALPNAK